MKNTLHFTFLRTLMILVFGLFVNFTWGQTAQSLPYTMPSNFVRSNMTSANGWTYSDIGTDYSSAGSNIKFDNAGDIATLYLSSSPGTLSFNLKGNGLSGNYAFTVFESSNDTQYTPALTIINGINSTNTVFNVNLLQSTRYVRWVYTTKANGNVGFGGVIITQSTNAPALTISASPALVESSLNNASINLTLANATFADAQLLLSNFSLVNAPSGVSIASVAYLTNSTATLTLAYDGTDFDTSINNLQVKVLGAELSTAADITSNSLPLTAVAEVITNSPSSLTAINYVENSGPSVAKSFTVASSNLKTGPGSLTITGSANYEVSTTSSTTDFGNSATLAYTGNGTFTTNIVYVRLKSGLPVGNYNSQIISVTGGGATSSTTVSGSVTSPPPANDDCGGAISLVLDAAPISGSFANATDSGSATCGGNADDDVWYKFTTLDSGIYTINIIGSSAIDPVLNLRSGVCGLTTVTCQDVFGQNETLSSQLAANTTYFIRLYDFDSGSSSTSTFTIRVTAPVATLTTSELALTFGNAGISLYSQSQAFNLSGNALTGAPGSINVVSPSTEFQVSNDNSTWGATTTVAYTSGALSSTPVYVRFSPQSVGNKTGNITFSGGGVANAPAVALSGSGIIPSPVATNATAINMNNFTANWNSVAGATEYKLDVSTLVTFGSSQTLVNEGFEASASLPSGWITTNWTRSTNSGDIKNGNAAIICDSNSGTLTTKALVNPTNMTFYLGRSSNTSSKTLNVEVSTTSQTSGFTTISTFTHANVAALSYDQYTVDLSAYSNSPTVYIRFTKTSSTTSPWRVDDIVIQSLLPSFVNGYENLSVAGTSQVVSGLSEATNYYYRVRAVSGSTTSLNSNVIDVSTASNSTTWNGTTWSNGTPSATLDAIIAGNYSTASAAPQGPFTAKSLTVNSGAFTVASATSVTVENAIVNNAGVLNFVVESGANLIQNTNASNAGAIKVKRNSNPLYRYDYTLWSSPVVGQNLKAFSSETLSNRFYQYNTATNTNGEYELIFPTENEATYNFISGKGYLIRTSDSHPIYEAGNAGTVVNAEFVGTPFNQNLNVPLSNALTGFNLVGNPYPSAISIAQLFTDNQNAIDGTIWFWRKRNGTAGSGYATSTGMGIVSLHSEVNGLSTDGVIKAGQGFFVKVKSGATQSTLNFNNSHRSGAINGTFFRSNQANEDTERHRIWLNISKDNEIVGQTLLGYMTGATEGIDYAIEGKYFNDSPMAFSSLVNNQEFAIQGRSLPFASNDIVPMAFKTDVAGNYTISIDHVDGLFAQGQDVFLKDNFTGQTHDIKASSYNFASQTGVFNNRFEVVYQSTLNVEIPQVLSNNIVVYKQNGNLVVNSGTYLMSKIELYDVSGRLVFTKSDIGTSLTTIENLSIANQVLVVKVTTEENGTANKKIVY